MSQTFSTLATNAGKFFSFVKSQIFNLRNLLIGLGAIKIFKFTIGGAAEIEQVSTFLQLQLGAQEGAKALDFVTARARASIFSFEDLAKAASTFSTILKKTSEVEEFTKFAERLSFLDPVQGFSGAALALKEVLSGETRSLRMRFELPISEGLEKAMKTGALEDVFKELDKLIPVTGQQLEQLSKTGSGAFQRLGSNIQTSFKLAGNKALQFLKPVLTSLNDAFEAGKFDDFFDSFAIGIAVVVDWTLRFVERLRSIGRWIDNNSDILIPIIASIGSMALVIGGVTIATKLWAGAQWLVNLALAANPIGLVILLVVGLIGAMTALILVNDKFRQNFAIVFLAVVQMYEDLANFWIRTANAIIGGLNSMKNAWATIWGGMFNLVLNGIRAIITGLNLLPGIDIGVDVAGFRNDIQGVISQIKSINPQLEKVDFGDFATKGFDAINNFDGDEFIQKIKDALGDKFNVPEMDIGAVNSDTLETETFGAGGSGGGGGGTEGFTLNEFIIDNLGNILDGTGRESFIHPIEDNRRIEIKLFENSDITGDVDINALKDLIIDAIEEALEEDINTNSSLVFGS